ncbi:ATP-binding protein [Chryseolinea lacunae]|uniref:histidine kinase n=1 Tax=Chryseolinea lacunae TaxID=2801331 RepID=A0ABS1KN09_9BACT|nr:ATP-binding protein [Chryseolinea lacunae]MBL0740734.1 CHASE3 domain-containing protein [Chryseolinea lacunae]
MNFSGLKLRGKFLTGVVFLVVLLIIIDVVITRDNNRTIQTNRFLQKQAEQVKVNVSQFAIVIIHNLDLGLRGYALFGKEKYLYPYNVALKDKDSVIAVVEKILAEQNYPLQEFHQLSDSLNAYASFCTHLKALYDNNKKDEFLRLGDQDRGYDLWLQYEVFARKVYAFEDQINETATAKYNAAINKNYVVQIVLFLICVPALLIMARHTLRKFAIAEDLKTLALEKAQLLADQNATLEEMVRVRTEEIYLQNQELQHRNNEVATQNEELTAQQEEITSQRDQLATQNEMLSEAKRIIESKNKEIEHKNDILEQQVEERTKHLLEYNQQLEQFTFISAHNLRAPVARILGLGGILRYANSEEEKMIIDKLISTTTELDTVVKDLNDILVLRKDNISILSEIDFGEELELIKMDLEKEMIETGAILDYDFSRAPGIRTIKSYLDSILINLISNAIKYRHPGRSPLIQVRSDLVDSYVCLTVSDNGLGMDLSLYKEKLFTLYGRFHNHVEGKGMGLYLVMTQVVALGGKIEVESEVDRGTTFKILLKD